MSKEGTVEVRSEIGRLRRALVHAPGREVDRMVPAMMEQLLFDDILYGDRARDEHARFRRVFQHFGIELLDASDLLAETLAQQAAREWVIDVLLEDLPSSRRVALRELEPEDLAAILVSGTRRSDPVPGITPDDLYSITPLPNWCFQRDPQVIFGDGVILCSMAAPARYREALLTRTVFRFHPELRGVPVLFDPIEATRDHPLFLGEQRPGLEGGDVLVFSDDLLVIGISERTNRVGVRHLARTLAASGSGPRWLVLVEIPRRRAYMHLDTLITPVDRDACLVHAPVILPGGSEAARVYEVDLASDDLEPVPREHLLGTLANHGLELEPIPCGGADPVSQQREQWTDGANAFALAPGVIALYDRNVATAEELARRGFEILEAEELLLGRREISLDGGARACVLIASNEMSRARGGPHCLVHPLWRDPL